MTPQEEEYVKDIFKFFYPTLSPPNSITDDLGNLAAVMLKEALEGSKLMDFVPRPPGFMPGIGWLLRQAVQTFWRRQGKRKIYDAVRVTVALRHRSEYEIAKAGI